MSSPGSTATEATTQPFLTFRTDATTREIAAAGARVLVSYDSFALAQGPATALGRLSALGRYALSVDSTSILHLLHGNVDVRQLSAAANGPWNKDVRGRAAAIVHFIGPVAPAWIAALADRGVMALRYIPANAFLVLGTPAALGTVRALPFVDWVGPYEAAWKLRPGMPEDGRLLRVRIVALPDEPADAIAAWLAHAGVPPRTSGPAFAGLVGVFGSEDVHWVEAIIDSRLLRSLADLPEVEFIEPVYPVRPLNAEADWVIQTNRLLGNGSGDYRYWWYGLDGRGQVIGIADTGLDFDEAFFRQSASAIALGDLYNVTDPTRRKVVRYVNMGVLTGQLTWPGGGGPWDPYSAADCPYNGAANGHGTAVASVAAGNNFGLGTSPNNGNALQARIYMQDVGGLAPGSTCLSGEGLIYLPPDYGDLFGLAGLVYNDPLAPVRIHSDSWGGDANVYDLQARQIDAFLWSHPDLTVLFAAGNNGPADGTIGTPATAKGVVSVGGACNADGTLSCTPNDLASFSSRGPNADGRYSPTIITVANGDSATSDGSPWSDVTTTPDHNWAGTSYATPEAAAAAAIVRQYFTDGWYPTASPIPANGFAPSAALIRAMLIASGVQITGQGTAATTWPNNGQGFGRVLLSNVLPIAAAGDGFRTQVVDQTAGLLTGQAQTYTFRVVPGASIAKFVLSWTDYPGTLTASKALVNDLDLQVTAPDGTVYRGNRFGTFGQGQSVPGGSFDTTNVEEAAILKTPLVGDYTVQVIGSNIPVGPQRFALVATGGLDANSGRITLDRPDYREDDTVNLAVVDADAIAVQVLVASTLEAGGEAVTLSQAAPGALWRGTIRTAFGQPTPDGVLQVRGGDTITAVYQDLSPAHTATATAIVDATAPAIADVSATDIGATGARIRWSTDRPATTEVRYGTSAADLSSTVDADDLVQSHSILLQGLQPGTLYFYDVVSTDHVGHATTDANGGRHYAFRTADWGDVLVVIGDVTFPAEREESYANALASTGWTWALWRVADLGPPPLTLLQQSRAVVWQVGLEQYPPFNGTTQALLRAYLNGGGRLLVSSHDAAWALASTSSPWYSPAGATWVQAVLKAGFDCDPSTTAEMNGVGGDPISGAYSGGIAYTPHRSGAADDEIAALAAGGTATVVWTDSTTVQGCSPRDQPAGLRWVSSANNGTAGTAVWGGTPSRLVYFAFELTGLDATATDLQPSSPTRAGVFDNALRWLVGTATTSLDRDHPDVTVTAPTGGVFTGPTISIDWTASASGPGISLAGFSLDVSPDGGQTWTSLANATGTDRSYAWSIGAVPNGDAYLVRVVAYDSGTPSLSGVGTTSPTFAIRQPGGDAMGPLIRPGSLGVSPNPPGSAAPAWINATADDRANGASAIVGAELFFSLTEPIPASDGLGLPMSAADGAFNASVESLAWSGPLPLAPGNSCAWAHARDADGNWGPYNRTCFPAISVGADVLPPAPASLASLRAANGEVDLLLTWDRAWDDGLYGGTARYRVLRSTSPQGPFLPLGSDVNATGNLSYAVVDAGRGSSDPSNYFYRVETIDAANNIAEGLSIAVKVHVAVTVGVNLLGLPADPGALGLDSMAAGVGWTDAWAYRNCGGAGWTAAMPGSDGAVGLRIGRGFWFNATAAGTLVVLGITPATTQVSLCPGWNLVSLPGFAPGLTVGNVRSATGALVIVGYDPAGPYHTQILSDSTILVPGRGYWIFTPTVAVWTVDGW